MTNPLEIVELPRQDRTEHAFNLVAAVDAYGAYGTCILFSDKILTLRAQMKCVIQRGHFDRHVLAFHQTVLRMELLMANGGEPMEDAFEAWKSIQMLGIMAQSGSGPRVVTPRLLN